MCCAGCLAGAADVGGGATGGCAGGEAGCLVARDKKGKQPLMNGIFVSYYEVYALTQGHI